MKFREYTEYIIASIQKVNDSEIQTFVSLLYNAFINGQTIFIVGNGGSAANASHLAEDLAKGTCLSLDQEKRIKALSLTDNISWISALSNDNGYEIIFEQQLRTFAKPGDILIAISGSGNSLNILKAIEWANSNNLTTVGITGFNGGKLMQMAKQNVHVPLNDMCSSESIHSLIFHYAIIELQAKVANYMSHVNEN